MATVRNGKTAILLRKLGIPANLLGWKYIDESVNLVLEDPMMIEYVTKRLYPSVAKTFNTTPTRVERAIRRAKERALSNALYGAPMAVLICVFGNTLHNGCLTNSEFIAGIAQVVGNEPDNPVWK